MIRPYAHALAAHWGCLTLLSFVILAGCGKEAGRRGQGAATAAMSTAQARSQPGAEASTTAARRKPPAPLDAPTNAKLQAELKAIGNPKPASVGFPPENIVERDHAGYKYRISATDGFQVFEKLHNGQLKKRWTMPLPGYPVLLRVQNGKAHLGVSENSYYWSPPKRGRWHSWRGSYVLDFVLSNPAKPRLIAVRRESVFWGKKVPARKNPKRVPAPYLKH